MVRSWRLADLFCRVVFRPSSGRLTLAGRAVLAWISQGSRIVKCADLRLMLFRFATCLFECVNRNVRGTKEGFAWITRWAG